MDTIELRNKLTSSLSHLYDMEAFSCLAEFLQGELHVLLYLSQHMDTATNPSILSNKLHVSRSRITSALSSLKKKGYVEMNLSENDRRRICVTITPDGLSFIRGKQKNVERYFDAIVEGLGRENILELIRLIDLSIEIMADKEKQL